MHSGGVEIADIDRLIAALGEAQATIADLRAQLATSESVRALETKTLQQVTADLESARAEVGQPSRNYWEALNMLRAERDAARHDLGRAREERDAAREAHEEAARLLAAEVCAHEIAREDARRARVLLDKWRCTLDGDDSDSAAWAEAMDQCCEETKAYLAEKGGAK
jgi:hypothetical protein